MLLELAIGDAYGAGFEYVDRRMIELSNNLFGYVQHPGHDIRPGEYTDDTQMSLAIAEAIVSGEPWTRELLADKFVEVFKRDSREGYASGFYAFLTQVQDGAQFLREILPTSNKSGAAMRACPIGVFPSVKEVIERTTLQAKLTHDTPDGIRAAVAAALMTHYFLYNLGKKRDLGKFLESHVVGTWSKPYIGKVKAKGWMSVSAAVTAIMACASMSSLLKTCIDFGGDVDTVATVALATGSCCSEIDQDLPEHLERHLENRTYGRDYIIDLDERLMVLVRR